jgi:hypothetical protein
MAGVGIQIGLSRTVGEEWFTQQGRFPGSDNTTLTEVGLDAAGGFTIVQTSADTSSQQETGNSVSGAYSLTLYLTQGYTLAQTDTARPGVYTVTETGTAWTVRQETGSSLDGTYQATATGSDQYAVSETGFEGNVNPVSATLTGVDSSVLSANGNALTGDLSSTQAGQGGVSGSGINGTAVSFTVQESGNALAGGFTLAETGTDRNDLLPQFNNPASGAAPGTQLFSGEGPAYGLGPVAGVNGGGAIETGGSSAQGAASVRATGYDDGSGRMARVRAAATAILSATDPNAGAVQQQPAAQLGAEIFKQDCFAAGTPLETPTGAKFIEYVKPGDLLLAATEGREDGPVEAKVVEEVFEGLAQVVNLHVRGRVIRTTPNHRFWAKGLGWLPCAELRPGDLLRSRDGQWVAVEGVTDSGEEVPVYNVRVADHKTYFVGCHEWGFSLWAHNTYADLERVVRSTLGGENVSPATLQRANGYAQAGNWAAFRDLMRPYLPELSDRRLAYAAAQRPESGPINMEQAQGVHDAMAAREDIAFGYPTDGCYARAELMADAMEEAGHNPGKVWAFARLGGEPLHVDTENHPDGFVEWGYHVAPTLQVRGNDGTVRTRVIDPSMFDHPVTVDEWVGAMNCPSAEVEETARGQAPTGCAGSGYWPDTDPARGVLDHAEAVMEAYLPLQGTDDYPPAVSQT